MTEKKDLNQISLFAMRLVECINMLLYMDLFLDLFLKNICIRRFAALQTDLIKYFQTRHQLKAKVHFTAINGLCPLIV